jgi:L-xylulokinase
LFADTLKLPVHVAAVEEAAAFGAALCAGAAIGRYKSPQQGARDLVKVATTHQPDFRRGEQLDARYQLYSRLAEAMKPLWPEIEAMESMRSEPLV